jgi:cob(I)alamin adenosyltransferase
MALAQLRARRPEIFRQLERIGLNKLYRVAQLPKDYLKKLTPRRKFRIPGTSLVKTMEEMNPVELNRCAQKWTRSAHRRRPNQVARMVCRIAERLGVALNDLSPRLPAVRSGVRQAVRATLIRTLKCCEACLRQFKRTAPAA